MSAIFDSGLSALASSAHRLLSTERPHLLLDTKSLVRTLPASPPGEVL